MNTLVISSVNYNGLSAVITFYPETGGTINIGTHTLPYNYVSDYLFGEYTLSFPDFGGSTCTLYVEENSCPFLLQENGDYIFQENNYKICVDIAQSPTPTPTISITPSITPSLTPSETPTPSITPSLTPSETPTPSVTPTVSITPTPTPTPSGVSPGDSDANAFIAAANITDVTQQNAITTLVTDLKTNNIWSKLHALYPFVGGTADSNKWNLKNPTDSDSAFRLTFSGGVTHTAAGIVGNGINGFAQTYNDFSHFNSPLSAGLSFGLYASTVHTFGTNRIPFGGGDNYIQWLDISNPINTRFNIGGEINDNTIGSPSDTIGYFAVSQNTNSTNRLFYNRTTTLQSISTPTIASIVPSSNTLLDWQGGGAPTNNTVSTAYISNFLNSTDMTNLRTIILNYNSTLGR
jgi:hypothetical protein